MGTCTTTAGFPVRRARPDHVWLGWLLGWVGLSVLAMTNGILRRGLYEDRVGQMAGHYISTAVLIAVSGGYMSMLNRRWPIATRRRALAIGGVWTALTIGFESGLGRLTGTSWSKILEQYNILRGYVWILVPMWTGVGPLVVRALRPLP